MLGSFKPQRAKKHGFNRRPDFPVLILKITRHRIECQFKQNGLIVVNQVCSYIDMNTKELFHKFSDSIFSMFSEGVST